MVWFAAAAAGAAVDGEQYGVDDVRSFHCRSTRHELDRLVPIGGDDVREGDIDLRLLHAPFCEVTD